MANEVGGIPEPAAAPFGEDGRPADRDPATGRFARGNLAALVAGARSAQFWAAQEGARREIVRAVLLDAGFTDIDAPRALSLAADGIAQAALMRDSAFLRVVEDGGPMTASGRTRRAFSVWLAAGDRLERYLRLVGLRRVPKPIGTLEQWMSELEHEDHPAGSAPATTTEDNR